MKVMIPRNCDSTDLNVKELIEYLFAGYYDGNDEKTKYSNKKYRSQEKIIAAIKQASGREIKQPVISKCLKKLCGETIQYKDSRFVIYKTDSDGYVRVSEKDFYNNNLFDYFTAKDIYYNDSLTPTEYIFRLNDQSNLDKVKELLNCIFRNCLFRITTKSTVSGITSNDSNDEKSSKNTYYIHVELCPLADDFINTTKDFRCKLSKYYNYK